MLNNDLIKQIENDYGTLVSKKILDGFNVERKPSLRINTLKISIDDMLKKLDDEGILYDTVPFFKNAVIINNRTSSELTELESFKNGEIYLQSVSSMIPPLFLEIEGGEDVLDMAAAPGGKTTEIAILSNNKSRIMACEANKIRTERLKYNIEKQGALNVNVMNVDSRKLDDFFKFDRILLDAPCSGSGTIVMSEPKSYVSWSMLLMNNSSKIQLELLKKALKMLKPGCVMVYSTCSVLKIENEKVLKKALENSECVIEPIDLDIEKLPSSIEGVLTVCPNEYLEGFFVAKIRKIKK